MASSMLQGQPEPVLPLDYRHLFREFTNLPHEEDRTTKQELERLTQEATHEVFFPDVPRQMKTLSFDMVVNGVKVKIPTCYGGDIEKDRKFSRRMVQLLKQLDKNSKSFACRGLETGKTIEVKKGEILDLVSLLTLHGKRSTLFLSTGKSVDPTSLVGKYVILCCFNAPILWDECSQRAARAIAATYQELHDDTRRKGLCRLVVIARMRPGFDDESHFRHFLSGFPGDTVIVPFHDPQRREFICNSLGLRENVAKAGFILDPDQRVMLVSHEFYGALNHFGAEAFPFTSERIRELYEQFFQMRECKTLRPGTPWKSLGSLGSLLGCKGDPSNFYLYNNIEPERNMSIAQLEMTLVAVYLCGGGYEFISDLIEIQGECRKRNLDLELILVYNPYVSRSPPLMFQKLVNDVLQNLKLSCWVLPFKDSVTRRIGHFREYLLNDWLIVVGPQSPHGVYMDPAACFVIQDFGIDAYPFTRKSVFDMEMKRVKNISLDLVLPQSRKVLRRVDDAWVQKEPRVELCGKSVILYLDRIGDRGHNGCLNDEMLKWYNEAKNNNLKVEVIFICIDHFDGYNFMDHEIVSAMPWLVCPYNSKYSDYVVGKIFKDCPWPWVNSALVAFGKDGDIRSLDAVSFLFRTAESLVLEDTLAKDVMKLLRFPGYRYYLSDDILQDN